MEILAVCKHSLMITLLVFVMMVMVDFIDAASGQRITHFFRGGRWRQYSMASFLGATPGCLGAFMNVSLYVHGIIGFGAIVGGMIATSGDEAFVMLTQFPGEAVLLFGLLFVLGILFAWLSDKITQIIGFVPCKPCLDGHCEACLEREVDPTPVGDIFHPNLIMGNIRTFSKVRFIIFRLFPVSFQDLRPNNPINVMAHFVHL